MCRTSRLIGSKAPGLLGPGPQSPRRDSNSSYGFCDGASSGLRQCATGRTGERSGNATADCGRSVVALFAENRWCTLHILGAKIPVNGGATMLLFGYARVSTPRPGPSRAGCGIDGRRLRQRCSKTSGARSDRRELAKVIRRLETGDVLVVTRLDRRPGAPATC
jgi:hypothetical protein